MGEIKLEHGGLYYVLRPLGSEPTLAEFQELPADDGGGIFLYPGDEACDLLEEVTVTARAMVVPTCVDCSQMPGECPLVRECSKA